MFLITWVLLLIGYDHNVTVEEYSRQDLCEIARWGRVDVRDSFCVEWKPAPQPSLVS